MRSSDQPSSIAQRNSAGAASASIARADISARCTGGAAEVPTTGHEHSRIRVERPEGVERSDAAGNAAFERAIAGLSPQRQARLRKLRAQIQQGTYQSSARLDSAIERMLNDLGVSAR